MIGARQLNDGVIEAILASADPILRFAMEAFDVKGGYLHVTNQAGLMIFAAAYGEMSDEKAEKYSHFAREKALRLAGHPSTCSSWQTRNLGENKFSGAIRGRLHILSFSGFPELLDEAAMLVLAIETRQLDITEATLIAQMSGNSYFSELQLKVDARLHPDFCGERLQYPGTGTRVALSVGAPSCAD